MASLSAPGPFSTLVFCPGLISSQGHNYHPQQLRKPAKDLGLARISSLVTLAMELPLPTLYGRALSSAAKASNLPTIQDETQVGIISDD